MGVIRARLDRTTARSIYDAAGGEIEALITYDRRLADVAKAEGLRVIAPA